MRKFYLAILFTLFILSGKAQSHWYINFEPQTRYDSAFQQQIIFDTIKSHHNMWQVGRPHKTVFDSTFSYPNAIITDTVNSVQPSDTSVFYLRHGRSMGPGFDASHWLTLNFKFKIDEIHGDKALVEVSPDAGHTWVNLITQDSIYKLNWWSPKPFLSGSHEEWQDFYVDLGWWADGIDVFPTYITADTLIFRFTFISDSSATPRDGWMIDNFHLEDLFEGVNNIRNDNLVEVFPNPAAEALQVKHKGSNSKVSVEVMDCTGRIVINEPDFKGNVLNVSSFAEGIYFLRYSDAQYYSVKKFVVNRGVGSWKSFGFRVSDAVIARSKATKQSSSTFYSSYYTAMWNYN